MFKKKLLSKKIFNTFESLGLCEISKVLRVLDRLTVCKSFEEVSFDRPQSLTRRIEIFL